MFSFKLCMESIELYAGNCTLGWGTDLISIYFDVVYDLKQNLCKVFILKWVLRAYSVAYLLTMGAIVDCNIVYLTFRAEKEPKIQSSVKI